MAATSGAAPPGAVVFDLGGVLIDWSPYHLYRRLFASDAEIAAFIDEIDLYGWLRGVDADKPFEASVHRLAERFPHRAEHIRAYWQRWPETIRGDLPATVEILRRLKARAVPVYALTNWSSETWHHASRFDFLAWFADIVVSGHEGVAKPDPAIFDIACRRFGVRPGDTVFIDDSAANVDAAAALGFHAHRFTTADTLERQLRALGLPL